MSNATDMNKIRKINAPIMQNILRTIVGTILTQMCARRRSFDEENSQKGRNRRTGLFTRAPALI